MMTPKLPCLLVLTCIFPACDPVETGVSPAPAPTTAAPVQTSSEHCELVNGPKGCAEDPPDAEKPQADATDLAIGINMLAGFVGAANGNYNAAALGFGTAGNLMQSADPAGVEVAAGTGGGCEWKGRAYTPGDFIDYRKDGEIYMRDVLINGEPFYSLVTPGESLSQPGDRAQRCECQTSSRHWICV